MVSSMFSRGVVCLDVTELVRRCITEITTYWLDLPTVSERT